ncbi:DBD_Tnp_Mut domain-containing protein [Raphanus sativus]|nr:DBD_Tnp_Mut domain-containing protein [Raphanus sativus]
MARMVTVGEEISIRELERRVLREFNVVDLESCASLSYWPPDSLELATWIKTLHVVLTSDGALKYFFTHLKVRGSMNLFATLEHVGGDVFQGSGSVGVAFETPVMD